MSQFIQDCESHTQLILILICNCIRMLASKWIWGQFAQKNHHHHVEFGANIRWFDYRRSIVWALKIVGIYELNVNLSPRIQLIVVCYTYFFFRHNHACVNMRKVWLIGQRRRWNWWDELSYTREKKIREESAQRWKEASNNRWWRRRKKLSIENRSCWVFYQLVTHISRAWRKEKSVL